MVSCERSHMEYIQFLCYDTLCSIRVLPPPGVPAAELLASAEKIARQVETTLNMYDSSSELSQLCARSRPHERYPISPILYEFLDINLRFAQTTGGVFDPTVGPLVKAWRFGSYHPKVPEQAKLNELLRCVGYEHVHLAEPGTVFFDTDGIILDPGGAGKGFALGLVSEYFRQRGVTCAALDFGGNLFVIGNKPGEGGRAAQPWLAAIQSPHDQEQILGTVPLSDQGIATSSWYEHSFYQDGVLYHHIIEPSTGKPKPIELSSVSIISSQAVYTDLMSTAFFLLGIERGEALIRELKKTQQVDLEYVAVLPDGTIRCSDGAGFQSADNS